MKRTAYDTAVKHLYRKGLEETIPDNLRQKIPRSTIHRWRHESSGKYIGCDLNDLANSELELLRQIIRSKNSRKIFITYVRIGRFLQSLTKENYLREQLKKHKMDMIDVVERARKTLPFNQVLKCFNLSKTTYNLWVLGLYSNCHKSKSDWCLRRQPHQLNHVEIENMKRLLTANEFSHWPISSIAHHAKRKDLLHTSIHLI